MKITIYQKPTCTTCRKVSKVLEDSGVDFELVNYYIDPIPKAKLKELIQKMGIRPEELIRKHEDVYEELKLADKQLSDNEWIDYMVQYPDLIQRPIVEKGSKAILARPAERIEEIL